MIYDFVITFVLALLVSFSTTPLAKKLAFKIGAIDVPKDNRRMHTKPIARMGGLAIVSGFFVAIMYSLSSSFLGFTGLEITTELLGFFAGVIIISILGVIDDIKPLDAKLKLFFQILAALCVVLIADIRIVNVTNPFSPIGITFLGTGISYIVTICWIIGITNAFNLIDGLDGLSAGVSSISSLSLFFVSLINGDYFSAVLTSILAGATLGFLPFNFNPAKIFMGDTGSTFLGFTLATISIQGMLKSYAAISIAIPLLVLGLPLFDTIFTIFRRLFTGKSIMTADRGHLHHKLVDMGLSHKQSVVVMYTVSASLGLCAIVLADKGVISAIILVIAVSIFIIGGAKYMTEITEPSSEDKNEEEKNLLQS